MTPPRYVGPLADTPRQRLESGRRSRDAFELRRCQMLLARARGERPSQSAAHLGPTTHPVRHGLRAYRAARADGVRARSSRPNQVAPRLDAARGEPRRTIVHESPRAFGQPTRLWTLARLATVGGAPGLTPGGGSLEAIRRALPRRRVSGTRATHGIPRPALRYAANQSTAIG